MQAPDSEAQYLDSYSHERPALVADVSPLTTSTHIVVVRQINIKHKLSLHRHELAAALQTCRQVAGICLRKHCWESVHADNTAVILLLVWKASLDRTDGRPA